jgi:rfaE bifunctional protein nucleotidyltransferase chain/domain
MSEPLLIVGDSLLDRDVEGRSDRLCPDAPVPVVDQLGSHTRPGGAGLAALLAAATGIDVILVTALAADPAGRELGGTLASAGIEVIDLGLEGATPEKIRVLDRGRPLLRLDRGGGRVDPDAGRGAALAAAVDSAAGILVSDYGNGVAALDAVRRALARRPADAPLVWDPHPRGPDPIPGADLVTPNRQEAAERCGRGEGAGDSASELAILLRGRWRAESVVVTCGGEGAVLAGPVDILSFGGDAVEGDSCGAGDRFAVEASWTMACGGDASVAVSAAATSATFFVAVGGARGVRLPSRRLPDRGGSGQGLGEAPVSIEPALRRAASVRAAGGTVVATGGCFDLLHAGHLQTLRAARELGDSLIVLLNGDRSVRRLKGASRPLVGETDRAALLAALDCVDEVVIFDEDTPAEALSLLRPDIWVKGGDYADEQVPEREALADWGGRLVLLPFLAGKSTTRLIEKVGQHG